MMMRKVTFAVLLTILGLLAGCSGGGGNDDGNNNALTINVYFTTTDLGTDATELTLKGPIATLAVSVTYYVFGSNTDLGARGMVPMQNDRLDEQSYGPLYYGDSIDNVDLSPWAQYPFIYLRVVGAVPNNAYKLEPGKHYEFDARL
ncbi:hypothetical protein JW859_06800 [bacterium]|nr:hypothetical protein [bacterium]